MGRNLFLTGKIAFFSKIGVFNNLLGPKEIINDLQNICQNNS